MIQEQAVEPETDGFEPCEPMKYGCTGHPHRPSCPDHPRFDKCACGHVRQNHIKGAGLCLVRSCKQPFCRCFRRVSS